jgi:ribosomal protein L7/L12
MKIKNESTVLQNKLKDTASIKSKEPSVEDVNAVDKESVQKDVESNKTHNDSKEEDKSVLGEEVKAKKAEQKVNKEKASKESEEATKVSKAEDITQKVKKDAKEKVIKTEDKKGEATQESEVKESTTEKEKLKKAKEESKSKVEESMKDDKKQEEEHNKDKVESKKKATAEPAKKETKDEAKESKKQTKESKEQTKEESKEQTEVKGKEDVKKKVEFTPDPKMKEKLQEKAKEILEEQKKAEEQWGKTFDEQCFHYEKEWEKIAKAKEQEQFKALTEELTEEARAKIDFVVDKLMELNILELKHLSVNLDTRYRKSVGISPITLNTEWPDIKMIAEGTWPPLNPNWYKDKQIMEKLSPFIGAAGPVAHGQQAVKETPKEPEAKKETGPPPSQAANIVSIEMVSFTAAGKLKVIREYKVLSGLGLKEAKEKVESVPFVAFKNIEREKAEEIVKKFESYGAKMTIT